jgi:hypothetical protein
MSEQLGSVIIYVIDLTKHVKRKGEHMYYFEPLYLIRSMDEAEIKSLPEIGTKLRPYF